MKPFLDLEVYLCNCIMTLIVTLLSEEKMNEVHTHAYMWMYSQICHFVVTSLWQPSKIFSNLNFVLNHTCIGQPPSTLGFFMISLVHKYCYNII